MTRNGRKSLANENVPRAGNFELLDTVRKRTFRMLKTALTNVSKLTDEEELSSLTLMREEIMDKWADYQIAFEEHEAAVVGAGTSAIVDTITNEYMAINATYVKMRAKVNGLIADVMTESRSTNGTTQHQPEGDRNQQPRLKLAPLKISPYDGSLASNWMEFKATCEAVLKPPMSEIQRLQELKNSLFGEARDLVSHILPSDHAYDEAMLILKERYENVRAIANSHFTRLYAIPKIDKPSPQVFRDMWNTINGLLSGLKCCNVSTSSWDPLLIFHLTQRFDSHTLTLWEEKLDGKKTIPTLAAFLSFLQTRITVLSAAESPVTTTASNDRWPKLNKQHQQHNYKNTIDNKRNNDKFKSYFTLKSTYRCAMCTENHLPSRCDALPHMSKRDRIATVCKNNLCQNCFYPHNVADCPFEPACKKCSEPHHTLLHVDSKQMFLTLNEAIEAKETTDETKADSEDETKNDDSLSTISGHHFYHVQNDQDETALLATALVPIRSKGRSMLAKCLIDQGSTTNLITIHACDLLKLHITRLNAPMYGVGNSPVGTVIGRVSFQLSSIHDKMYILNISALVVRTIGDIRGVNGKTNWKHLHGLSLADPKFHENSKIDILLGNASHADFILSGVLKGKKGEPIAQKSKLGWIVSGGINVSNACLNFCRFTHLESATNAHEDLIASLKTFWEIEEVNYKHIMTQEETLAEEVFKKSVRRADDGKFIVDLPFKSNPYESLGESYSVAKSRYHQLQRKFDRNPQLKTQYDSVLEEYLALKHMEIVSDKPKFQYFLPHHGVFKESTSTKLRTVFNASSKTSTGVSLNDCLCVGPVVQPELFDLLIGWRKFEFAVSADIEKMYRMLYVSPKHTDLLSILWHRPGTSGIATYRLLTVTFGTSCGPFQATRGLHEIGEQIKSQNKKLADIIQKHFYVDDFLKSFSTISEAQQTSSELTNKLSEYGFKLRKWKSNDPRTIQVFNDDDRETTIDFESTFKTLGIAWQADTDSFVFKCLDLDEKPAWTKRSVLSTISKLFDPLGWLAPFIVKAKILLQNIWRDPTNLKWDAILPDHLSSEWKPFITELTNPIALKVPRWIKLTNKPETIEIHSFCDASNLAYACCVYLRVIHVDGSISCNLIAAKTKVAPVRVITIPRLELCGALLLANLTRKCIQALQIDDFTLTTWCDSKIVLAWLATHPTKWTTFVANRVSQIQEMIDATSWKHVPSKLNPADVASRGCSIEELNTSDMWWHGPPFLLSPTQSEPKQELKLPIDSAPEQRKTIKVFHIIEPIENYIVSKFENYHRLLHFTSMALRWLHRVRNKATVVSGPITADEIQNAETHWIKFTQIEHFSYEIDRLKKKRELPKGSLLLKLTPYIDDTGFLRMNGRVKNDEFAQQKTSIILPAKARLVMLIIRQSHQQQTLHGGVQLTLRALRERFWIIHARHQVSKLINRCMVCYRTKRLLMTQQMAELPSFRTQQAKPFTFVGVDYAGPFNIKTSNLRNAPLSKGYIALFICLTTKAIHLEIACDQSTAEFIMVLENFICRRGIPAVIYSDNGGNFVGAESEIQELHNQWLSETGALTRMLAEKRITFKRLPANASHMAGIWERAVGLVKYHLKRVMKNTKLNARQFDHVLKQVECCLNSRPLWAQSPNADDIEVITPAHFWNFQPINTLPRPDLSHLRLNQLDQYQYLHRLYCEFWKYWVKEYIDQFQLRPKWNEPKPNLNVGHIVVVSNDNLPPSRWSIGKVVAVHPAKDGHVRVVDVKVGNSVMSRPIHRLGVLPLAENEKLSNSHELSNARENVVTKMNSN